MTSSFELPLSIEDCQDQMIELLSKIEEISLQLADPDRRSASGTRLAAREYKQWQHQARRARYHKMTEYRRLKLWRQEFLSQRQSGNLSPLLSIAWSIVEAVEAGQAAEIGGLCENLRVALSAYRER